MSDAEFRDIVRRAMIMLMTAFVRRYGWSWFDFLPRYVVLTATPLVTWTVTAETIERG